MNKIKIKKIKKRKENPSTATYQKKKKKKGHLTKFKASEKFLQCFSDSFTPRYEG
jgi:hypothetical protein